MTKLDGDARGGALLSVKHVTGVPIRFIGTGEHLDNLEVFRPEGMASRILGMGDMLALVDEANKLVDEKEQIRMQEALEKGQFNLNDFRSHMQKMAKPGLMQKMMGLMPGMPSMGDISKMMNQADTSNQMRRMVGVIDSMTAAERVDPSVIDIRRKQRIAQGAGVDVKTISELLKNFGMMKKVMTGMAGMGASDKMQEMQKLQSSAMNPNGMPKMKKSTGKRLTPKELKKRKKEREKQLKAMRKKKRGG